ncbi:MAG: hypothetical protein RI911_86 [Candidatus Parcubacteria bacterium]|jgi:DNA primase
MSGVTQQIKDKLDIVEVLSVYLKLQKAGSTWKARCPFHGEKTPSFVISPSRQSYHCFGCGEHGDIFTFVEKIEGTDFKGALRTLAERAGVELVYDGTRGPSKDEKDALYELHDVATKWYVKAREEAPEIIAYLKKRGLTEKSIESFQIGFVPNGWRRLHDALLPLFSVEKMQDAGLVVKGEKGAYDRFRSRIMFPLFDSVGRVIGFSGRIWNGDEKEAKYVNTPETILFHKSKFLYGFDRAKTGIRTHQCTLLVEGQMDLIACHQVGYTNAVALSGTALTDDHAQLLGRISKNIIIALDGDGAGVAAAIKSARLSLRHGFDVKIARFIGGKDASAIVEQGGAEALKEVVRSAVHVVDFLLAILGERSEGDQRVLGRLVESELFPVISDIQSPIEREHTLKTIATRSGISFESLAGAYQAFAKNVPLLERKAATAQKAPEKYRPVHTPETILSVYVSWLQKEGQGAYTEFIDRVLGSGLPKRDTVPDDIAVALEHEFETHIEPSSYVKHGEDLLQRALRAHVDAETIRVRGALQAAQIAGNEALAAQYLAELEDLRKRNAILH